MSERLIDPAVLMSIQSLELRARGVVEGMLTGLHRSPYHGHSVEFSEYRHYVRGDDLRHLDWRLYARSDRYYVKQFEDETNLRCQLLVDTSRSMNFGSLAYSKSDYARTLAATLGYFLTLQRDAVGLLRFDAQIEATLPPRYRPGHLRRLLLMLEEPSQGVSTDLTRPLEQAAERMSRRGMLVLISDLLAPADRLETQLGYLRSRGHDVIVFQILDPTELTFPFDEASLFEDMESGRELYVDPATARAEYTRKLQEHLGAIEQSCANLGIDYRRVSTSEPLEGVLGDFVRFRGLTVSRSLRQRQ
ncbi:MAG: DUF58 domain-containing protein [Planctomycetaceae bacterium]